MLKYASVSMSLRSDLHVVTFAVEIFKESLQFGQLGFVCAFGRLFPGSHDCMGGGQRREIIWLLAGDNTISYLNANIEPIQTI